MSLDDLPNKLSIASAVVERLSDQELSAIATFTDPEKQEATASKIISEAVCWGVDLMMRMG